MSFSASRPLPLAGTPTIVLLTPDESTEFDAVRTLFREYAAALGVDLGFQHFEEELASLPGDYAEPRGALLLALVEEEEPRAAPAATSTERTVPAAGAEPLMLRLPRDAWAHVAGCCALRPLDSADDVNAAEMKRLYVRPDFRGLGLGRQLAEAILDFARGAGYGCVLLDTLDDMESARALYEDLGFVEVPPYYHNPIAGSHYLKAVL